MYGVTETIETSFVPTLYFPGLNESGTADDVNNIQIGTKSNSKLTESKYLYLQIDVPKRYMSRGYLTFRFFFDYED